MAGVVAALGEFIVLHGLGRPHVAGNSLGGGIALELGAAGLVSSVTALSPAGFFTEAERRRAVNLLRAHRLTASLPAVIVRRWVASPATRARSFAAMVARPDELSAERAFADACALRSGRGFEPVVRAGRGYAFTGTPTVPVTIAWVTEDRVLPPVQATRAAQSLPDARHVSLPGCGHVPMSDDPTLVVRTILETTGARPTG